MNPAPSTTQAPLRSALETILGENRQLLLEQLDPAAFDALAAELSRVQRIFTVASGRSGLVLRMVAMRLMHLGLSVHVVGDATTPAIRAGDLLLAMSGSGSTPAVLRAVQDACRIGSRVAVVTTAASSPLAQAADLVVIIPAATKHDRSATASAQYAGSLFEQGSLLAFDAFFQVLIGRGGKSYEELWARHANLE